MLSHIVCGHILFTPGPKLYSMSLRTVQYEPANVDHVFGKLRDWNKVSAVCCSFYTMFYTSLYFSDPSGLNRFFLSSLLLLHRSRISAVLGFFLLTMFAKDLTGCFSLCCVEGGDHFIQVCVCIVHDGEKCKLPTYHS